MFELEVVLKKSLVNKYAQMVAERLPDRIQSVFRQLLEYSYGGSQRRGPRLTDAELFNRFLKRQAVVQSDYEPALKLTPSLFGGAVDFGYAIRPIVTPAIKKIAAQILSCPYRGSVRRRFLRDKALALISEYLETVCQPAYPLGEMDRIYEAAAILRANITNPPGIEELAQRVYTNRLKLYQGFHAVYGTTPVGYLRSYRISVALKQFYTSTRSVSQVAAEVGYSNRSRFASAFYQLVGMNPKTFQLQLQRQAS
ncbi:MAG: AraC family transcriptional regulator [Cyanobacteria bacterium P01_C01_bin.89]